jgi:hypothetical protein
MTSVQIEPATESGPGASLLSALYISDMQQTRATCRSLWQCKPGAIYMSARLISVAKANCEPPGHPAVGTGGVCGKCEVETRSELSLGRVNCRHHEHEINLQACETVSVKQH